VRKAILRRLDEGIITETRVAEAFSRIQTLKKLLRKQHGKQ